MQVERSAERPELFRFMQKAAVLVGGLLLLAIGMVLLFLPGPGVAVIFGGLAVLATEYRWARRALERGKSAVESVRLRLSALARPRAAA